MTPATRRAIAETTVALDTAALQAVFLCDEATQTAANQPRRRLHHRTRRAVTPGERAALLATVRTALADHLVDARALRSLMRQACAAEPHQPYEAMRSALALAAPAAGYTCPTCQGRTPASFQARSGLCAHCQRAGG